MQTEPLVSVIIVNFNGKKYLKNCLDSLYQGSYKNIEIIFVDNGSKDASVEFIKDNYKGLTVVALEDNLGLSVASNRGSRAAKGKYLFFYNNDTIADINMIASLTGELESNPGIGIAGCKTYTYDGKRLINAGVPCDIFGYPYAKAAPFYVDAGIFIRKDLFEGLGGFDEKMFLYGEDRDICWRCWLSGYSVEVSAGAKFFHDSACITGNLGEYRTNINKRFWSEFNALRSILKNYGAFSILLILPWYTAINLGEVLLFLLMGKVDIVKDAYLRSYVQNLKLIKNTLLERKKIQRARAVSDWEIILRLDKISGKARLLFDMGIPRFSASSNCALSALAQK
jgi:GT2 family glycosyltransferase